MTLEQKVALWDVVNDYMLACGGRERTTSVARQNAVVLVEGVVDALLAGVRREATNEGLREGLEMAAKLADAESSECGKCGHDNEGSHAADNIARFVRALAEKVPK